MIKVKFTSQGRTGGKGKGKKVPWKRDLEQAQKDFGRKSTGRKGSTREEKVQEEGKGREMWK